MLAADHQRAPAGLWAVTTLFNLTNSRLRIDNFRTFRRHLPLPLVAVEFGAGGRFELQPGDADILHQVSDGDILWQKERLLNIAFDLLPTDCTMVAWIDSDVILRSPDWMHRAAVKMERFPLVQLFSEVAYLKAGACVDQDCHPEAEFRQRGLGLGLATCTNAEDCLNTATQRCAHSFATGFAWAARRELLEDCRWFDACIIGGGDTAFVCAASGHPQCAVERHRMNEKQQQFYTKWAARMSAAVDGAVSYIDGEALHLWHGTIASRKPQSRHDGLAEFQFDPTKDVAISPQGCWQWASPKPGLHRYLREYFQSRALGGESSTLCSSSSLPS